MQIRDYYSYKARNRDFFDNVLPSIESKAAQAEAIIALPNRDQLGRRIVILRAREWFHSLSVYPAIMIISPRRLFLVSTGKWNPKEHTVIEESRVALVLAEIGAYEPATQIAGEQIIIDVSGLTMQHIRQYDPFFAKKVVDWILVSI